MRTICVYGAPHHNANQPDLVVGVVDVPEDPKTWGYAALVAVWSAGGCCPDYSTEHYQPPTFEQYEELLAKGRLFLRPPLTEEGEEFGEASWDDVGTAGFGFYLVGEGDDKHVVWVWASGPNDRWGDKWTATHVHFSPWEPDQDQLLMLLSGHTREQLAVLVLRERARRGLQRSGPLTG